MRGKVLLAAAAVLLGSVPTEAQTRPMPVRMAAPPARPMVLPNRAITYVRPAPPVRVVNGPVRFVTLPPPQPVVNGARAGTGSNRSTISANAIGVGFGGTPIPLDQLLNGAPGLGFDFTHLAAINGNLAVRAIIDPLTQYELALATRLPQVQPTGFFPAYGDGYGSVMVAPAQPQVIVIQQPVPQAAAAPQVAPAPAPQVSAPPSPPLPDVGEFLLVRRDGTVIRAVAFSKEGSQIVYITAAGLRHTVPVDQLDLKSTEERNAERGTILHLTD